MRRVVLLALLFLSGQLAAAAPAPLPITITAYTWSGFKTASGKWPAVGMLALSRDLEHTLGVKFGQQLTLQGMGTYRFECRMHHRWRLRADIYVTSRDQALQFGKRRGVLSITPRTYSNDTLKRKLASAD